MGKDELVSRPLEIVLTATKRSDRPSKLVRVCGNLSTDLYGIPGRCVGGAQAFHVVSVLVIQILDEPPVDCNATQDMPQVIKYRSLAAAALDVGTRRRTSRHPLSVEPARCSTSSPLPRPFLVTDPRLFVRSFLQFHSALPVSIRYDTHRVQIVNT